MRHASVFLTTCLLLTLVAACGESDGPTGTGAVTLPNGTFSGTVGGSVYSPSAVSVDYNGDAVAFGSSDLQGRSLAWSIPAQGPGTYTISTVGANANWTDSNGSWVASAVLGSGSVTFSTLSIARATGTFNFLLVPLPGTAATGNRTVTGTFNLTY